MLQEGDIVLPDAARKEVPRAEVGLHEVIELLREILIRPVLQSEDPVVFPERTMELREEGLHGAVHRCLPEQALGDGTAGLHDGEQQRRDHREAQCEKYGDRALRALSCPWSLRRAATFCIGVRRVPRHAPLHQYTLLAELSI